MLPAQIATLTRRVVDPGIRSDSAAVSVWNGALTVTVSREPLADSLEKARETGLVTDEADRLFADREGDPLDSVRGVFETVLREARLTAANVEGQAATCAPLRESRNGVTLD